MQVFDEGDVTWNNPAFAAPYLLLRNAREAVCLRMPLNLPLLLAQRKPPPCGGS